MTPRTVPSINFLAPEFFPTEQAVAAFEKDPPILHLIEAPSYGGFGLAAGGPIKKGQIVCYYAGECRLSNKPTSFKSTIYSLKDVDPSRFGGIGSFVNDGPPNCVFTSIYNYRGIPEAPILIAVSDIPEGEQLWTYYGDNHSIYEAAYVISPENFDRVKNYCLGGHFYNVSNEFSGFSLNVYILSRLSVFFRLLLEKALEGSKTKNVLWRPLANKGDVAFRLYTYQLNLIDFADHFLSLKNNALIEEIITSLLNGLRLLTFLQILSKMQQEGSNLTVERVKEYKILGLLTDYLYFLLNGTYIGTYHVANLDEQKPEISLDLPMIRELYSQLSSELKDQFNQQIIAAIGSCSRQGWMEEFQLLTQLTQELYLGQ